MIVCHHHSKYPQSICKDQTIQEHYSLFNLIHITQTMY